MTLDELNDRLISVKKELDSLLKDTGYYEEGSVYNVEYDKTDPEQELNVDIANTLMRLAKPIVDKLSYLSLPVRAFGDPEYDSYSERYHIGDNYLSSGDMVEVLLTTEDEETGERKLIWRISTIEYDPHREDYFFFGGGAGDIPIAQSTIRIR